MQTPFGKLMFFCIWLTKIGNASHVPPTMYIYDVWILSQKNYFQLVDLHLHLVEEAALLNYAKTIEVDGFAEPLNCLRDNLAGTEYAFDKNFFSQNEGKLLNYNTGINS